MPTRGFAKKTVNSFTVQCIIAQGCLGFLTFFTVHEVRGNASHTKTPVEESELKIFAMTTEIHSRTPTSSEEAKITFRKLFRSPQSSSMYNSTFQLVKTLFFLIYTFAWDILHVLFIKQENWNAYWANQVQKGTSGLILVWVKLKSILWKWKNSFQ